MDGLIPESRMRAIFDGWLLEKFPVGYVYISASATNPGTLFGGTWVQIQDKFLLGAGANHAAGTSGGEETVALTAAQNGKHGHDEWIDVEDDVSGSYDGKYHITYDGWEQNGTNNGHKLNERMMGTTETSGSGEPHNNMPPYLAVYMWRRTA